MAVPTVVGVSFKDNNSTNTIIIDVPAATQAGDIIIAMGVQYPGYPITFPSGWTSVVSDFDAVLYGTHYTTTYCGWHLQAAESSYTFNSTNSYFGIGLITIRGADPSAPIHKVSFSPSDYTDIAKSATVTTTIPNTLLVFGVSNKSAGWQQVAYSSWTIGSSGATERLNPNSPTPVTYYPIGYATLPFDMAGATGGASAVVSNSDSYWGAILMAIAPASTPIPVFMNYYRQMRSQ